MTFQNNQKTSFGEHPSQIMRTGVYGVVMENEKILTVRQKQGLFAGKWDFPGGGIEFGESVEQALRREFLEEVAMEFGEMLLLDNLTATTHVTQSFSKPSYSYHQIGLIYRLSDVRTVDKNQIGDLQHGWVNLNSLSEEKCSPLLWKYKMQLETTNK